MADPYQLSIGHVLQAMTGGADLFVDLIPAPYAVPKRLGLISIALIAIFILVIYLEWSKLLRKPLWDQGYDGGCSSRSEAFTDSFNT